MYKLRLHCSEAEGARDDVGSALLHQEAPATPDGHAVAAIAFAVHRVKHGSDAHPPGSQAKAALRLLTALDQPGVPRLKGPAEVGQAGGVHPSGVQILDNFN